jgi:DNA adenine methylase
MQTNSIENKYINAKPFLKWAGGKTQLLDAFNKMLPKTIHQSGVIDSYIEPFLGGGALFFFLKRHFIIKKSFLYDNNKELIVGYITIKNSPKELIEKLSSFESSYHKKNEEKRKEFFYDIRELYNNQMDTFDYDHYNPDWIERTVYLIFLNKTCFNGLFRTNKKGKFNVPFGTYKNPTICDKKNILEVNMALEDTEILCSDFSKSETCIEKGSFVYFDPPYRPLNKTSIFTSYSKDGFFDEDQERLSKFFSKLDKTGAYLMLSNSDPKNENIDDEFFDNLYKDFNIERIPAKRFINSKVSKRGNVNEIIVRNY